MASTFYVDSVAGNDANPGTNPSPKRTLAGANAVVTADAGDTVVFTGTFNESLVAKKRTIYQGSGTAVLDGGGTLAKGVTCAAPGDMTGMELRDFRVTNYTRAGVQLGGSSNAAFVTPSYGLIIDGLEIDHIIKWDLLTQANSSDQDGPKFQDGIDITGGDPTITNTTVHHIGMGGESHGFYLSWCHDYVIDGCEAYAVRKEGFRTPYCYKGTIKNCRAWLCTYGFNEENAVATQLFNNYAYDCPSPFVAKHNNNPSLGQPLFAKWGLTRSAAPGTGRMTVYDSGNNPVHDSRWWHNTAYGSALYHFYIANGAGGALYNMDARNNFFAGTGPMYLFDTLYPTTSPNRDDTVVFDYNAYSTFLGESAPLYQNSSTPGTLQYANLAALAGSPFASTWEAHGQMPAITVADPHSGDPAPSATITGGVDLTSEGSSFGSQVGAILGSRSLKRWRKQSAVVIDCSTVKPQSTYATLTDDQTVTGFAMATATNEWIVCDFGQSKSFRYVRWDPFSTVDRNVCDFTIETADSTSGPWTEVFSERFNDGLTSQYIIDTGSTQTAWYVRFTGVNTRGNVLHALEPGVTHLTTPTTYREISFGEILDTDTPDPPPNPPEITSLPTIVGTLTVGQGLTCSTGVWLYTPTSYSYQWKRNGTTINGATSSAYTITLQDASTALTCVVTAANAAGTASSTADPVEIPAAAVTLPALVATVIDGQLEIVRLT